MALAAQQELIRQRLRMHGFHFCDDGLSAQPDSQLELDSSCTELRLHAVESSSCDHESQAIENTLSPHGETFWSSTGHDGEDGVEYLIYRLQEPCNSIRVVSIDIYRARYQLGFPIYPPKEVRFSVGMDCRHLWPVPKSHTMLPSHRTQHFFLPPEAPPAHYIKVNLIGKVQKQLEDMRYYHAISRVRVWGRSHSSHTILDFHRQNMLPLRTIPALITCRGLPWLSQTPVQSRQTSGEATAIAMDSEGGMDIAPSDHRVEQFPSFVWHGPVPSEQDPDLEEDWVES